MNALILLIAGGMVLISGCSKQSNVSGMDIPNMAACVNQSSTETVEQAQRRAAISAGVLSGRSLVAGSQHIENDNMSEDIRQFSARIRYHGEKVSYTETAGVNNEKIICAIFE